MRGQITEIDRTSIERPETPPTLPLIIIPFSRDKDFVGRETILDEIDRRCSRPGSRTALVGLGGVGKSQLAIEHAYRTRSQNPEKWVFWIHASNAARFEQGYREIAHRVKIAGHLDPEVNIFQLVHDWLYESQRNWMLILDSIDDARFLAQPGNSANTSLPLWEYLPLCANGTILVTTRSREAALTLVEAVDIVAVDTMHTDEALTLFKNKLGLPADIEDNVELMSELEFLPLAIVQAARYIGSRLPHMSAKRYLEMLRGGDRKRSRLLSIDSQEFRRDAEASNSIFTTWQISFDYIRETRPSAADLLSLMCFFDAQGIPENVLRYHPKHSSRKKDRRFEEGDDISEASSSQTSESDGFEDDISSLLNFSFILIRPDGAMFVMQKLVQLAMRIRLKENGQLEKWNQRFIRNLSALFPTGEYENWTICGTLFPHARSAATQPPEEDSSLAEWATLLYHAAWYAWRRGNASDAESLALKSMKVRSKVFGKGHEDTLSSMVMLGLAYHLSSQLDKAEEVFVQVVKAREQKLKPEHPDMLSSLGHLASTYRYQGRWNEAQDLEVQVMEVSQKVLGAEHPSTLTSMDNLASTLWNQGRWNEADELFSQVLKVRVRTLGPDNPDTLKSMENLASTNRNQGRWDEAEELEVQVVEKKRRVLGAEAPDTLISIGNLALTFWNQGRWDKAEDLFMYVMETSKKVLRSDHACTLSSMANLAMARRYKGKLAEAEILETQILGIQQQILGKYHPSTLTSMVNLASTFWNQGRWNDAEKLLVEAAETSKREIGQEHPDTLSCIDNLATVYRDQGRWTEAALVGLQVMETSKRIRGEEHPDTLSCMANLATTRRYQGQWNEAEELERQVMQIRQRMLGAEHPSTLQCMTNLATTLWVQGRWKEAESLSGKAMSISLSVLGEDHPDTLSAISNLATLHWLQGQWADAQTQEMRAIRGRRMVLGAEHPDTLSSMNGLALIYKSQGLLNDAEDLTMQVVDVRTRVMGPEHPHTLSSVGNLATLYRLQKRWDEAEQLQQFVQTTTEARLGKEHPDSLSSMSNLASIYSCKGKWKEAEELDLDSIRLREIVLGENHPETLISKNNLARTYQGQQRWNEAEMLSSTVWETMRQVLGPDHPHTLGAMAGLAQTWRSQGNYKKSVPFLEWCVRLREQRLGPEHPTTKATANALARWQDQMSIDQRSSGVHVSHQPSGTTMSLTKQARASDEWFERLDHMTALLSMRQKAGGYDPVKIAILDTGINSKSPYRKRIKEYKDYIVTDEKEGIDNTGHGTNGVYLTFKVIPEAEVYVARVWDSQNATLTTPGLVAEAIEHAVETWMVDIITLAFGFDEDYEGISCAIRKAKAKSVLMFAAASNQGNIDGVAFPARMVGDVICMFSSDGRIKPSSFNPAKLDQSLNFAVLGEGVEGVSITKAEYTVRKEGTSISTFIAAGLAALVLDFSMQEDCRDHIDKRLLKSVSGMSAVFKEMATEDGGYRCIAPWKVLECNKLFSLFWSNEKKRIYIAETISRALHS
ncbi:hypothetical protein TruAng_006831 [Truncatella angustata]|nr:hypothetical protein TruAng_006831 [Truncatella angustata]